MSVKVIFIIFSVVTVSLAQNNKNDGKGAVNKSLISARNNGNPVACKPPVTETEEDDGSDIFNERVDADNTAQYECIPFHQCPNGTVIVDGSSLIDIRFNDDRECIHYLETCCKVDNDKPIDGNFLQSTTTQASTHVPKHVKSCGFRNENGLLFSITGNFANEAQYAEFPWMLAVLQLDLGTGSFKYKCGASLIAPNVALTGGHCVHGIDPVNLIVRGGEWDTQTTNEIFPHVDNYVNEIVYHEDFNRKNLKNDVALLFLKNKFVLSDAINTVCLPSQDQKYDEKRCFVSGWGKNIFGQEGKYQVILKKLEVPTVSFSHCLEKLKMTKLGPKFGLHKSFMCAGGEEGIDACEGDGGGPLVCPIEGKPGYYYQAGIVAWGIECGKKDVPGVYVDVAHFSSWINEKISART